MNRREAFKVAAASVAGAALGVVPEVTVGCDVSQTAVCVGIPPGGTYVFQSRVSYLLWRDMLPPGSKVEHEYRIHK